MSKARILLILGISVTILQYLGFPSSWKDILYILLGLAIIYIGYVLYKEDKKKTFDNFRENKNFNDIHKMDTNTPAHDTVHNDAGVGI